MFQFNLSANYFIHIYITPWCRIGPYIIGLLLGYKLFIDKKKQSSKIKLVI